LSVLADVGEVSMAADGSRSTIVTHAMEDYLKTIYELSQDQAQVTTSRVAERMNVRPASATGMLKTLAELHLVTYTRYYGVSLTPAGERVALEILRHHRLIERYLVEALGFGWDEVHDEADRLEHVISEKFEARIATLLGHPTTDPHGAPIPAMDGTMPAHSTINLADVAVGQPHTITRVRGDNYPERLKYLESLGLVPGKEVIVETAAPFDGPLSIAVDGSTVVLDRRMAILIVVQGLNEPSHT
jgi:DtxR family Mn-dependent transcriptional regulator